MDVIISTLLFIGITLLLIYWLKSELVCPPQEILYIPVPVHPLDLQFDEENNKPSEIHGDMFTKSTPWIGGYDLGYGKTKTTAK